MVYLDQFYQPTVIESAQAGDFRAIAYWLNGCLVPQGMWVCVDASSRLGFLQVTVKVQRPPECDRLVRFICYRVSQLQSDVIQGVEVIVQMTRTSDILWRQSARLKGMTPETSSQKMPRLTGISGQSLQQALTHSIKGFKSWRQHLMEQTLERSTQLKRIATNQLNHPYAIPLGGAALAAFFVGSGIEVIRHTVGASFPAPEANLTDHANDLEANAETVQTAVGSVPVVPHRSHYRNPTDTISLALSGEGAMNPAYVQSHATISDASAAADIDIADIDIDIDADTASDVDFRLYQTADVAIATLTLPTDSSSQNSSDAPSLSQRLADHEVDVVSLTRDRLTAPGDITLTDWIDELETAGIRTTGVGKTQQEARRPDILEVKGKRIAYFGYSDSDSDREATRRHGIYVNTSQAERVKTDLEAVRGQVDWIVVNYHWQQNVTEQPTGDQMTLARSAVDYGADLVVGHHPDALQGGEIYKGRAIAYSLGNRSLSDVSLDPAELASRSDGISSETAVDPFTHDNNSDYDTAALTVDLRDDEMRVEFVPIQVRESTATVATGSARRSILNRLDRASRHFDEPMSAVTVLQAHPQSQPGRLNNDGFNDGAVDDLEVDDLATDADEAQLDEAGREEEPENAADETILNDSGFPAQPPEDALLDESIEPESAPTPAADEPFITYSEEDESTSVQPVRFEPVD